MVFAIFYGKIFFWRNWKSIQFNKKLLAESEKNRDAINAIKKDIAYMPIELKKKLKEENIFFEWIVNGIHHNR